MMTNADIAMAADVWVKYDEACNEAGVSHYCPHGFRWDRCIDGCRMKEHGGRTHFEEPVALKFICRGHTGQ